MSTEAAACPSCGVPAPAELHAVDTEVLGAAKADAKNTAWFNRHRRYVLPAGVLIVAALVAANLMTVQLDSEAREACDIVEEIDGGRGGLFDNVVLIVKAIKLAEKSDSRGLREAATAETTMSELPRDNPLYENPGDYQYGKVAAWCDKHT